MLIRSTKMQVKEFIEGFMWQDMKHELRMWNKLIAQDYRETDSLLELGKIQGRQEALEHLLQLPQMLLQTLEEKIEENKDDSGHNGTE